MKKAISCSAILAIMLLCASSLMAGDNYEGTYIKDGRSYGFLKKKMIIKKTGDKTYSFTLCTKSGRLEDTYQGKIAEKPKKRKGMVQVLQFTLKTSNVEREVEVYEMKGKPDALNIQGEIYNKE